ncbi:MAG: tRNA pseudouridine(55) synthase TruB, partial [Pseudomonadota bacterium]|nr:tRNA pseudouridine(55) synthase TruB [Pseudomonadota bacterium]
MARRKKGRDISGILVVNKPLGLSSNQVLQRVKRLYNANKAGHTGALDPEATGVLPICLGEATKFSQLLLDSDKGYDTRGVLGQVRSTGDKEGEILQERPVPELNTETIETVLSRFRGDVEQVPPMF